MQRLNQRQDDLTHGVDAELVRDDLKWFEIAIGLIVLGFLLALLGGNLHTASVLQWVLHRRLRE
jgi:hypothetical protein